MSQQTGSTTTQPLPSYLNGLSAFQSLLDKTEPGSTNEFRDQVMCIHESMSLFLQHPTTRGQMCRMLGIRVSSADQGALPPRAWGELSEGIISAKRFSQNNWNRSDLKNFPSMVAALGEIAKVVRSALTTCDSENDSECSKGFVALSQYLGRPGIKQPFNTDLYRQVSIHPKFKKEWGNIHIRGDDSAREVKITKLRNVLSKYCPWEEEVNDLVKADRLSSCEGMNAILDLVCERVLFSRLVTDCLHGELSGESFDVEKIQTEDAFSSLRHVSHTKSDQDLHIECFSEVVFDPTYEEIEWIGSKTLVEKAEMLNQGLAQTKEFVVALEDACQAVGYKVPADDMGKMPWFGSAFLDFTEQLEGLLEKATIRSEEGEEKFSVHKLYEIMVERSKVFREKLMSIETKENEDDGE